MFYCSTINNYRTIYNWNSKLAGSPILVKVNIHTNLLISITVSSNILQKGKKLQHLQGRIKDNVKYLYSHVPNNCWGWSRNRGGLAKFV